MQHELLLSNDVDIAFSVGTKITDEEKYILLNNRFVPPESFIFPISIHRNLKIQRSWLYQFTWLAYSQSTDGAFCQNCVLFGPQECGVGRSKIAPQSLVCRTFKNWKKTIDQFKYQQNLEYHKRAIVIGENFIQVKNKKITDIRLQLDKQKREEIELNRKVKGCATRVQSQYK